MSATIEAPRTCSATIYEKSCKVVPGGVNSTPLSFPGLDCTPLVAASGKGATITDADGNSYLDYCQSWGALILGHANQAVLGPVHRRMDLGSSFGITTEIEEQFATQLVSMIGSIDMVRCVCSGTEATMSAVRLARGYTRRDLVVKFNGNYHGHADSFLVNAGSGLARLTSTSSSAGVTNDSVSCTLSLPYNDVDAVKTAFREHGDRIAAVIVEPVAGNMGVTPGRQAFINCLREETEHAGSVLIFDEVITGFRVAKGGAQQLYGVAADLTCFGKIVGGGFPMALFGGKREIMEHLAPLGKVYQAGTLAGNPLAMEAGYQTLLQLEQPGFYDELERKTALVIEPVAAYIKENDLNACIQSAGSMFTLFFGRKSVSCMEEAQQCDLEQFNRYFHHMFERGIYVAPSQFEACFVSSAHSDEELRATAEAIVAFLRPA